MSLEVLSAPEPARQWCEQRRGRGQRLGYVATMGALHGGHVSLLSASVRENDATCASIFVNPLQFNNPRDLADYPTSPERDLEVLTEAGCDMVFTGEMAQFFPGHRGPADVPRPDPGPAARGLEGEFRPGHLEGVAAIVDRLFHTVGDCAAYFGEKDFQQTLVVRELARRLLGEGLNIQVRVRPTVRESSGLALSSRNRRLDDDAIRLAGRLSAALYAARDEWARGARDPAAIEDLMRRKLAHAQIEIEYAAVRDEDNWTAQRPSAPVARPRALVAALIGGVRLIDNLYLGEPSA